MCNNLCGGNCFAYIDIHARSMFKWYSIKPVNWSQFCYQNFTIFENDDWTHLWQIPSRKIRNSLSHSVKDRNFDFEYDVNRRYHRTVFIFHITAKSLIVWNSTVWILFYAPIIEPQHEMTILLLLTGLKKSYIKRQKWHKKSEWNCWTKPARQSLYDRYVRNFQYQTQPCTMNTIRIYRYIFILYCWL